MHTHCFLPLKVAQLSLLQQSPSPLLLTSLKPQAYGVRWTSVYTYMKAAETLALAHLLYTLAYIGMVRVGKRYLGVGLYIDCNWS